MFSAASCIQTLRFVIGIKPMKTFFCAAFLVFAQMTIGQTRNEQRLAVHLVPRVKSAEISKLDLSTLKPAGRRVFDQDEIIYYRAKTHEFRLEFTAAERLRREHSTLRGKTFAVFAGNRAIYAGAFWSSTLSQSFDGVYVDLFETKEDYPLLTIRTGYPDGSYFTGTDRRGDPRLLGSLEKAGKLYDDVEFTVKCRDIKPTGKRRASFVMTFDVVGSSMSDAKDKILELELYFDQKEMRQIRTDLALTADKPIGFNRDKELVLTYLSQRGEARPDRIFIGVRKK